MAVSHMWTLEYTTEPLTCRSSCLCVGDHHLAWLLSLVVRRDEAAAETTDALGAVLSLCHHCWIAELESGAARLVHCDTPATAGANAVELVHVLRAGITHDGERIHHVDGHLLQLVEPLEVDHHHEVQLVLQRI
jgi:hypothetical protein